MKDEDKRQRVFTFEDLQVWSKAVEFAKDVIHAVGQLDISSRHARLVEQLESASIAVSTNIAEGKGRYSKEFIRYLYSAQGSLASAVSQLMLFHKAGWLKSHAVEELKTQAEQLTRMIYSLIKAVRENANKDGKTEK